MNHPISRRQHGMLDFPVAILLIAAPWLFAFHDQSDAATVVPIVIGVAALLMSLMTNYEFGVVKAIPMSVHVMVDLLAGIVLALSPLIFGFADAGTNAWLPHVVAGIALSGVALLTERRPFASPRSGRTSGLRGSRT
jgi:SPW repeat